MNYKRELLELAAKAAGVKIDKSSHNGGGSKNTGFDLAGNAVIDWHNGKTWNPLEDDGDALRLAANLGIDLEWRSDGRIAAYRHANANGHCFTAIESSREDRAAGARLAIVRAAAEIGRNMK